MANFPRDLTIVKLGGSLALEPHLRGWLTALARCPGRSIVVPGGGPFADRVRTAQVVMGFDDRAAHHMALLAMEQFGAAICNLEPSLVAASSSRCLSNVLDEGRTPVWMATKMALEASDRIPPSWEVTSDSLAAWLAGFVGRQARASGEARRAVRGSPDMLELAERQVVDPLFARYLDAAGAEAIFVDPTDHARAMELLTAPLEPRLERRLRK